LPITVKLPATVKYIFTIIDSKPTKGRMHNTLSNTARKETDSIEGKAMLFSLGTYLPTPAAER
jgi:hypothetical protein